MERRREDHYRSTIHHLIPKSRKFLKNGMEVNVYAVENEKRIRDTLHDRHHTLFENKTPLEQLQEVYLLNRDVLSKKVWEALEEIINTPEIEFYRPGLII